MGRQLTALAMLFSLAAFIATNTAADEIPYVYNEENTGAAFPPPPLPDAADLPMVAPLPDPFEWSDGSGRDTSFASWEQRRNEILHEIERYEIGTKPDAGDLLINAVVTGSVLNVTITRLSNGTSMTLHSTFSIPSDPAPSAAGYPMLINMALAPSGGGTGPGGVLAGKGIGTIDFVHNEVTTYAVIEEPPKANDPYYIMYPEALAADAGQYSAWSWGVSRLIDGMYLAANDAINPLPIDLAHLAVSGCSYAGKMALFAGAFDERVALTFAMESGGGGFPAWRTSDQLEYRGEVEKIDNTASYWFMQSMKDDFGNDNVRKLPHDHHELAALVLPRALFQTGNTDFQWLSNKSSTATGPAIAKIYENFGIQDRYGYFIDGGHGHCAVPAAQVPAYAAFVDKFLLDDANAFTEYRVTPYPEINAHIWTDWWGTGAPEFPDTDGDGVDDLTDNCTTVPNADQCNTNGPAEVPFQSGENAAAGDHYIFYGNACDADIALDETTGKNNRVINFQDLADMKLAWQSSDGDENWNPDADLNCNGVVNFTDLAGMKQHFLGAPGPGTAVPYGWPDRP